jgi:hypothetical protein
MVDLCLMLDVINIKILTGISRYLKDIKISLKIKLK